MALYPPLIAAEPVYGTDEIVAAYSLSTMRYVRRWRWLISVLVMYVALCLIGGVYLADATLHPGRRVLTDNEVSATRQSLHSLNVEMQSVAITTPDAVTLRGWLMRPGRPNEDAAILFHGVGDNRLGMVGYAELLLSHGFTVLVPDARGHGESGGTLATYGLLERKDIHQWVEFLSREVGRRCVYGMGESMGAAELLQSLATEPRFCAVVAESPFANFREIAYDRMGQPFHLGPWVGRTLLRPLIEAAFLRARWKYHVDMEKVSPDEAVASTQIPVLLIHGQIDGNIPVRHSRMIHRDHPQVVLWEVPGADHCGANSVAPQEFERRIMAWFEQPALSASTAR